MTNARPYDLDFGGRAYRDTGCDNDGGLSAPSCLACPFNKCKYDMTPEERQELRVELRDKPVMDWLRKQGWSGNTGTRTAKRGAEKFGVTTRTIWRIAARNQNAV